MTMISKRTLWGAIIVSMIIGVVVGIGIDKYLFQNSGSHFGKTRFVNYLTNELNLTLTQRHQLDSVLDYVHPKFQAIRSKFNTDMQMQVDSTQNMINRILTSEQQDKFRLLIAKMEKNHK
jgi:hypothetical protein